MTRELWGTRVRHACCISMQGMGALRLIIAEDDKDTREWLRLTLRPLHTAEIVEARDGAELLGLLLGGDYDLVVTDIRMPRRSGLDAAVEARRAGCPAAIIFITGYGDEETTRAVQALGRSVLLIKPFDGADLVEHIRRLLGIEAP
jgi:DNA-binding response OmpR family regulator